MAPELSAVECSHCGAAMSRQASADGHAYLSCPTCQRTFHTTYAEVLHKRAGVRPASVAEAPARARDERFDAVKDRLESFLRRVDDADPYFVLGVRPTSSIDEVRRRYRELALTHHPDRGGDPGEMRKVNRAYDRVRVAIATRLAEVPLPRGPMKPVEHAAMRAVARPAAPAPSTVAMPLRRRSLA